MVQGVVVHVQDHVPVAVMIVMIEEETQDEVVDPDQDRDHVVNVEMKKISVIHKEDHRHLLHQAAAVVAVAVRVVAVVAVAVHVRAQKIKVKLNLPMN